MNVLHPRCCGLDVHKSSISACILLREAGRVQEHQRRFGAMTQDLRELAEWLRQFGVTQVAMESSGVYWKPVWNILERQFTVVLANAQHIKNVPGRKTDQKDAEWIAQLLQYGLLRPSYVPCEIIRDLRDLTRMRASLSQEASRLSSRIQKVLEDANVKLASVATNALGKSGRAMLEEIISGEDDPEHLASLALGHLRVKIPQLRAGAASQCAGTGTSDGDPGASRTGAGTNVVDQHGARTGEVLRRAAARLQSTQPECRESTPAESGVAGGAGTVAGSHRIAEPADLRIQPTDREDRQGKLSASGAVGKGEGSAHADRADLPADAGRPATFSQESRRRLLCWAAAGAAELGAK